MSKVFLEVSYRDGKPFAAYLRLPHPGTTQVATTRELGPGLVADFDAAGQPLGLEIVHPLVTTVAEIQRALAEIHMPPVPEAELAPLRAA
ncbi:MAG: DUF2283 domain-containing protein [Myxococcota bacterium]